MQKIKQYYLELICATFLVTSASYFVHAWNDNRQNQVFLSQTRSKLLLMEARYKREIEQKINEKELEESKAYFESALIKAGFSIEKIECGLNYMTANVNNNLEAKANLSKIINVQHIEENDLLTIRWAFEKVDKNNQINIPNNGFVLNGICYFNDNSWQVWINGKSYDSIGQEVASETFIEKVTPSLVSLKRGNELIKLELN